MYSYSKERLIKEFLDKSQKVGNKNKIITLGKLQAIIKKGDFDYIHLNSMLEFNKSKEINQVGLKKAIVEAQAGIAETGSVILTNEDENYRRATELCESLIVILPSSKIVKSLEDTISLLKKTLEIEKTGYTVFITGASRTADIEMTLTLGVHGPETMEILIINNL